MSSLNLFISYSHADNDLRLQLETHLKILMERHNRGETRVIPVFLRSCDWKHERFGKLQGVPDGAKPITQWSDRDEAFTRVCSAIRKATEVILSARNVKLAGDKKPVVDLTKIQDIIDWDMVNLYAGAS